MPAAAVTDLPHFYDKLSAWSAAAAAVVALATMLLVVYQLRKLRDQMATETKAFEHQTSAYKAQMLLSLSEKWTAILPARYAMMTFLADGKNRDAYIGTAANPRTTSAFFGQEEWHSPTKGLRCVLNFFETLGLLIEQGYIDAADAFVLVSVDNFPDEATNGKLAEDGSFFKLVKPVLDYLRANYRSDMYVWYDQYLLPLYCKQPPLVPQP